MVPLATPHYMRSTPAISSAAESGAFVYRDQQSSREGIELTRYMDTYLLSWRTREIPPRPEDASYIVPFARTVTPRRASASSGR